LLQFGSSPKSAALQGQFDKARCRGEELNFLPFGWVFFPPNDILQTLKECHYKKWDLLCASLCDLSCILVFLDFAVQRLKSSSYGFS